MNTVLDVKGLCRSFGDRVVVDGSTFSLRKGDFTALLGPNGSGKTTTLKMCAGLLPPTSGTVTINGHDVHTDTTEAMSQVGCIIETPNPYPDRTPMQFLTYLCGLDGMNRESALSETSRVLELTGMTEHSDRRIGTFSKGMRQRIVIAQALLGSPSLLLLDEPTSGLDPRTTEEMTSLFTRLNREGMTILMSSHMIDEVSSICRDVIIMDRGRAKVQSTISDIRMGSRLILRFADGIGPGTLEKVSSLDGVSDPRIVGDSISIGFEGDLHSRARLIGSLVSSGMEICGLEEDDPVRNMFFDVTGGD